MSYYIDTSYWQQCNSQQLSNREIKLLMDPQFLVGLYLVASIKPLSMQETAQLVLLGHTIIYYTLAPWNRLLSQATRQPRHQLGGDRWLLRLSPPWKWRFQITAEAVFSEHKLLRVNSMDLLRHRLPSFHYYLRTGRINVVGENFRNPSSNSFLLHNSCLRLKVGYKIKVILFFLVLLILSCCAFLASGTSIQGGLTLQCVLVSTFSSRIRGFHPMKISTPTETCETGDVHLHCYFCFFHFFWCCRRCRNEWSTAHFLSDLSDETITSEQSDKHSWKPVNQKK